MQRMLLATWVVSFGANMPVPCAADNDRRMNAYTAFVLDPAGSEATNRILDKVKAGDLRGFRAEWTKNPKVIDARWIGLVKRDDDDGGKTALHFAARSGDLRFLTFLLKHGADVKAQDERGRTPLHDAANKDVTVALIGAGADVKAKDEGGRTPLYFAADKDVATALVASGADGRALDNDGWTPLHYAANRGVATVLLANKAEIERRGVAFHPFTHERLQGSTPLEAAARAGRVDVVRLLIERGADVNRTTNGQTPLYWAAYWGEVDVVRLLLAKAARVNGFDRLDHPLRAAVDGRQAAVVRRLVDAGANIPKADEVGWTLLHEAAEHCDGETIALLIKAGAKLNAKTRTQESDNSGASAIRFPPQDRFSIWKDTGTPSPVSNGKRTPLHVAAKYGNLSAAKVLIAHGADVNAKTTYGETPLSLSTRMEKFGFYPVGLVSQEEADAIREARKKEIAAANANRNKIAELIRERMGKQR